MTVKKKPEATEPVPDPPREPARPEPKTKDRDPWAQACPVCGLLGCRRHT